MIGTRFINRLLNSFQKFFQTHFSSWASPAKRVRLKHIAPVLAVVMGVTSCDICGTTAPQGYEACKQFSITSVSGLPNGPVKVSWTNDPMLGGFTVWVEDGVHSIGQTQVDKGVYTATFALDAAGANEAQNNNRTIGVHVSSPLPGAVLGECIADWSVAKKAAKKVPPKPTATTPPQPPQQQPQPPQPPANKPPVIVTIKPPVIILLPTPCPSGYSGDPAHGVACVKIPG